MSIKVIIYLQDFEEKNLIQWNLTNFSGSFITPLIV
jgi:hypothetical protein